MRELREPGPLPEWLERPLLAVISDFQQPRPLELRLGYAADWGYGAIAVTEPGEHPWAGSFGIDSSLRGAELLVELADGLQEQIFPETRGAWGEARPECPGHPHPAEPRLVAGEAWWVCPVDERRLRPIGG